MLGFEAGREPGLREACGTMGNSAVRWGQWGVRCSACLDNRSDKSFLTSAGRGATAAGMFTNRPFIPARPDHGPDAGTSHRGSRGKACQVAMSTVVNHAAESRTIWRAGGSPRWMGKASPIRWRRPFDECAATQFAGRGMMRGAKWRTDRLPKTGGNGIVFRRGY
jgi:hypothetical protein